MTQHTLFVRLAQTLYRIERPWGDVPMGAGAPSDVACDADGNVYCQLRQDPMPAQLARPWWYCPPMVSASLPGEGMTSRMGTCCPSIPMGAFLWWIATRRRSSSSIVTAKGWAGSASGIVLASPSTHLVMSPLGQMGQFTWRMAMALRLCIASVRMVRRWAIGGGLGQGLANSPPRIPFGCCLMAA
jgi:hypothetical protein